MHVYGQKAKYKPKTRALIGVVAVRNWLIEHADEQGGVMCISWEFDIPEIIVRLKPFGGPVDRRTYDAGLWSNANELRDQVARLLARTGATE